MSDLKFSTTVPPLTEREVIDGLLPGMVATDNRNTASVPLPWGGGWIDVTEVTITAQEGETAYLSFSGTIDSGGDASWRRARMRITVDGTVVEGDYSQYTHSVNTNETEIFNVHASVELTAGEHTIKAQAEFFGRGGGDSIFARAGCRLIALQYRGAGINGFETIETNIDTPVTVTAVGPAWQDVGYDVTVNTAEGERVMVQLIANGSTSVSGVACVSGYRIDGGTVQSMVGQHLQGGTGSVNIGFSTVTEPLSAGTHLIELMCSKGSAGTWELNDSPSHYFRAVRFKSFGIGAGTIVTEDSLASAWAQTAENTWQDTGLEITINTIEDEQVFLSTHGHVVGTISDGYFNQTRYVIDGITYSPISYISAPENSLYHRWPIATAWTTPALSAGSHTIKVQSFLATNSGNISWFAGNTLQATQYRGGLIPVRDSEGVEVVDKPSALEFGNGAVVSAQGSVARVDFPNASMGGYQERFSYAPGTDSTTSGTFVDIGTAANQTFTTPVTGPHIIHFTTPFYLASETGEVEFGISIDDGVTASVGERYISTGDINVFQTFSGFAIVNLAAGEHTIKPQWRRTSGSGTPSYSPATNILVLVQAQGSGINGLEVVEDSLETDWDQTSPDTWEDTGLEVTINTLEGERVDLSALGSIWAIAANDDLGCQCRFDIDGTIQSTFQYTFSDYTNDALRIPLGMSWTTPALSAGQHTIKVQSYRVSAGSSLRWKAGCILQAKRFKSFGIGAGTIVTEDTISGDFTISSAIPTYVDTGFEVSFTTIEDERVLVAFNAYVTSETTTTGAVFTYQIDGGTDNEFWYYYDPSTNSNVSAVANAFFTEPLTAGEHTIKIRAARGSANVTLHQYVRANNLSKLQVIQYRGGLIPVQDSGAEVVDKPSALNFSGNKHKVIASGTVATISSEWSRQATGVSANTNGSAIVGCTASGITITLDSDDVVEGNVIVIKDESGDATASPITIDTEGSETIDGSASVQITADYGVIRLYSDGTNWFSI